MSKIVFPPIGGLVRFFVLSINFKQQRQNIVYHVSVSMNASDDCTHYRLVTKYLERYLSANVQCRIDTIVIYNNFVCLFKGLEAVGGLTSPEEQTIW